MSFSNFLDSTGLNFQYVSPIFDGRPHGIKCHTNPHKGKTYYLATQVTNNFGTRQVVTLRSHVQGGITLGVYTDKSTKLISNAQPVRITQPINLPYVKQQFFKLATIARDKDYLQHKGISSMIMPNDNIRYGQDRDGQYVAAPLINGESKKFSGYQKLYQNKKLFLRGMSTKDSVACFVGAIGPTIFCEGIGNAILLRHLTGLTVNAVLYKNNYDVIRLYHGDKIIVADNDWNNKLGANGGVYSATVAADKYNAKLFIPMLNHQGYYSGSDVWDLWSRREADVIHQIPQIARHRSKSETARLLLFSVGLTAGRDPMTKLVSTLKDYLTANEGYYPHDLASQLQSIYGHILNYDHGAISAILK